jgi:hypothetical protein
LQVLSASLLSSLLSFWLPWIYSPFPFFMEFRNGILLQLFECIESTQNEVKRKMIETGACNDAPKSPARLAREEKVCATVMRHSHLRFETRCPPHERFRRTLHGDAGALECREPSREASRDRLSGDQSFRRSIFPAIDFSEIDLLAIYNEIRFSSDE